MLLWLCFALLYTYISSAYADAITQFAHKSHQSLI